jgi:hypothetical protein
MADGSAEQKRFLVRLFATATYWIVKAQLSEEGQRSFSYDTVLKTFPGVE